MRLVATGCRPAGLTDQTLILQPTIGAARQMIVSGWRQARSGAAAFDWRQSWPAGACEVSVAAD